MILKFNYLDNLLEINNEHIFSLEVENKDYFYRIVKDLYMLNEGLISDSLLVYDKEDKEINLNGYINIIVDYFNFEFNNKKYINGIIKLIGENVSDEDLYKLTKDYVKLNEDLKKIFTNIDIDVSVSSEPNIDTILKSSKLEIKEKDNILDNLYNLIDIESILKISKLIVFVNLKQYLNNDELQEFYKYCLYHKVNVLLINNVAYGVCQKGENKMIIDSNLEEIVL